MMHATRSKSTPKAPRKKPDSEAVILDLMTTLPDVSGEHLFIWLQIRSEMLASVAEHMISPKTAKDAKLLVQIATDLLNLAEKARQ